MKKYQIIIIGIVVLLITADICVLIANYFIPYKYPNDFKENIRDITQNAKIIDVNENHNQALDVAEYAVSHNVQIPSVIINFDTHSDVYLNVNIFEYDDMLSAWISSYLAKYPSVTELYWVMPREEAKNLIMRYYLAGTDMNEFYRPFALYGNSLKQVNHFKFIKTPLTEQSYTQEFYVDTQTGYMIESVPNEIYKKLNINFDSQNPNLKKVKITTCTEETLPDFKGREVFLSIDADYISNSGFDTAENFVNNKNRKQIDTALYSIVKTIKEKNIRPEIIDLTLSPQYLPVEDYPQLAVFYTKILRISQKQDALQNYKRAIDTQTLKNYEKFHSRLINF